MEFGDYLKQKRTEKGISQEYLANLSGMDRSYVSMLERGLKMPTITTLIKIGKALEIKPSDILKEMGI
jgi:transcriptional regulator with XRE-family HTH domain